MVHALVLVAFIKLLFLTDSPRFVAGLYTALAGAGAILAVAGGEVSVCGALFGVVLCGALSFAYFWSLLRVEPGSAAWWAVVLIGATVMAFIA